jgi:hypothetical protein
MPRLEKRFIEARVRALAQSFEFDSSAVGDHTLWDIG